MFDEVNQGLKSNSWILPPDTEFAHRVFLGKLDFFGQFLSEGLNINNPQ